ncbi:MAG TPA: hypothetical protein VF294_02970, partial [Polyangiaceae bacterium]
VEPSAPAESALPENAPRAAAPPPRSAAPESGPPGPPPPPPSDPSAGQIYEPPPPGFYPPGTPLFEPPPPPEPHHVAPRTSLWLGARAGVFIPFGNAWSRGTRDAADNLNYKGVPWSDYVSSGPMFELDVGARLSRNYNVFALWEHAELGGGSGDVGGNAPKSKSGDTDFWGAGIRATSDPDRIGFITELAVGWRLARAKYDDGSEVQFTQAPFEARLGLGAEFRLNEFVSLSPMFTLGVGSFDKVEHKMGHTIEDQKSGDDFADGHAWATLTFGGNFDVLGSKH